MAAPPHPAHPEHPPHGGSDNVVHDDAAAQQKLADAGYTNASLTHRGPNWFGSATNAAGTTVRAKRDYAMLALLLGCGLRRSELVGLEMGEVQVRQGHWAVVDLIGKGGHVRTVPIPQWVKAALDLWTNSAGIKEGKIFRAVARTGKVWGKGISQNVVWYVVKTCCQQAGLEHIAPHDLRRTCAKLCHDCGGEIEQIQFLLGHASIQTTERYLGCKQNIGNPVNDLFNLIPENGTRETGSSLPSKMECSQVPVIEQAIACRDISAHPPGGQ